MTRQKSLRGQGNLSGRPKKSTLQLQRIFIPVLAILVFVVVALTLNPPASAELLTRADSNRVCMMTNKVFPTPQTPVPIHGKTYYGCCSMCAGSLAKDPKLREAIDPVSKRRVDKAEAVTGVSQNGDVYYFENEKNMKAFQLP